MRKILALYVNEMIKVSKKASAIIIVVLLVVGVVAFGGLMKIQENSSSGSADFQQDESWMKPAMQDQLSQFEIQLKSVEDRLKNAGENERLALESEKIQLQSEINLYREAIAKDISLLGSDSYLAEALRYRQTLLLDIERIRLIPEADRTADEKASILSNEALVKRYDNVLNENNFKAFLEIRHDQIAADETLSNEDKTVAFEVNALWLKMDPTGEKSKSSEIGSLRQSLNQVENLKKSLVYNLNYSGQDSAGVLPLTPEKREQLNNKLSVLIYKLENSRISANYNLPAKELAVTGMMGYGLFMIILLMTILAGGAVSSEISTGSIKSLIISPARRWKIYTAKLLSLLSVSIVMMILLYVVSMVTQGLFFGFGTGSSYIYATNGVAHELGFYGYRLAYLAVNLIDVIIYSMLAFMLSIVTRNTAASVGISVATYFSSSIIRSFLSIFAKGDWMKFIPFSNLSLVSKFFPYDSVGEMAGSLFGASSMAVANTTTTFSLIYIAVLLFCMGYIGLDSFNRRDVK